MLWAGESTNTVRAWDFFCVWKATPLFQNWQKPDWDSLVKDYYLEFTSSDEESITPGVDPTKLFFLCFFPLGIKLGHFIINKFFSVCNKNACLPAKNGKKIC